MVFRDAQNSVNVTDRSRTVSNREFHYVANGIDATHEMSPAISVFCHS